MSDEDTIWQRSAPSFFFTIREHIWSKKGLDYNSYKRILRDLNKHKREQWDPLERSAVIWVIEGIKDAYNEKYNISLVQTGGGE